jgi:hypothetical protein
VPVVPGGRSCNLIVLVSPCVITAAAFPSMGNTPPHCGGCDGRQSSDLARSTRPKPCRPDGAFTLYVPFTSALAMAEVMRV